MSGGPVTTVIGDVSRSVVSPPVGPPSIPPFEDGPIGPPPRGGPILSPFETALVGYGPLLLYRFRDGNFNTTIDDQSGGAFHLVKQNDPVTRATYKVREKARNSAFITALDYASWAASNQMYQSASNVAALSGATECTLVMSMRLESAEGTATDHHLFHIGPVDTNNTTGSDNVISAEMQTLAPGGSVQMMFHTNTGGYCQGTHPITGRADDGVNRLYIMRYDAAASPEGVYTVSKPGHENLAETASNPASTSLKAASQPARLNGRVSTGGSGNSPEYAIDAIAVFDSDIGAAAADNLHSLWMAEYSEDYYPSTMLYDGSTGFYGKTYTSSGNLTTLVCRFNRASFTGDKLEYIARAQSSAARVRAAAIVFSSDYSDSDRADTVAVLVQDNGTSNICFLFSPTGYLDGSDHVLHFAFDGDNGTAVFRIDGTDADDTGNADRVAPVVATLGSGASSAISIGSQSVGSALNPFGGTIGFFGHADAYLTNYADFGAGTALAAIDEKNWPEWDGRSAGDIGMTTFDGSTGYYSASATTSGNAWTIVARVKIDPADINDTNSYWFFEARRTTRVRCSLIVRGGQFATAAERNKLVLFCEDNAGTDTCVLISIEDIADNQEHVIFASYNATTGAATFYVDGVDADDTGQGNRILTTGTLEVGTLTDFGIGARSSGTSLTPAQIGYIGYRDAYLTNYTDFSTGSAPNKDIDEIGWDEWGDQPLFWNRTAEMTVNLGSAGNMTANGTITPPRPPFWSHTGEMTNNKGSAGDMTQTGTITMQEGGSPS